MDLFDVLVLATVTDPRFLSDNRALWLEVWAEQAEVVGPEAASIVCSTAAELLIVMELVGV